MMGVQGKQTAGAGKSNLTEPAKEAAPAESAQSMKESPIEPGAAAAEGVKPAAVPESQKSPDTEKPPRVKESQATPNNAASSFFEEVKKLVR